MHTEVFDNIDLLVNMADSEYNIDEVNTELIAINDTINNKKKELDELKNIMVDTRYFNEANNLVDKNIQISLKNKIKRLNKKLKELDNTNLDIKTKEKTIYQDITNLKELINSSNEYLNTLNNDNNLGIEDIITKEEKHKEELTKTLKDKEEIYNNILMELELNNQASLELKDKLNTLNNRLDDVIDSLNNPNTYIDNELKEEDENKLNNLTKEIEELEKRKLELLTNASLIASDAKELIVKDDINNALKKIKELVTIVKSKPYMDETNTQLIEEELDKKENLRNELVTIIDTKNYEESDNELIKVRIDYLTKIQDINNNRLNEYDNLINNTTLIINNELSSKINEIEESILKLEDTITKYRELIKDKNNKDRANLENVLTKKERLRVILNDLLKEYKNELLNKIQEINSIKELKDNLLKENNDNLKELAKLNKLSLLDIKVKDLLLEEEDENKLTKVNEEIKALKNRLKYNRTPDEIYDEIDISLGTKTDINIVDNILKDNSEVLDIEPVKLKVVDVIPVGGQNGA